MASDDSNKNATPPSKKQKMTLTGVEDRISQLPDSLLIEILSLLPTEDVFRTCTLSKRWSAHSVTSQEKFVSFVDYVLAHSVTSKIKKFQLDCSFDLYRNKSEINRWLNFVVERKVEDTVLITNTGIFPDPCTLPESFCTCSSLVTLYLKSLCLDFGTVIDWKALKLENFELSDDVLVNLLSGCPALETMELSRFEGNGHLEIRSSKLKRLSFKSYVFGSFSDQYLDIIASYVQHLKILGTPQNLQCRLVDVSSVVSAKLTFDLVCIKEIEGGFYDEESDDELKSCSYYHQASGTLVRDNLQMLSSDTKLTIGGWLTKVISMFLFHEGWIPQLKCKYLTLKLHMDSLCLHGAASILLSSPHLETLIIDMAIMSDRYSSCCGFELRCLAEVDHIDQHSWNLNAVFPKLKNVKIIHSRGCLKNPSLQGCDKLFKLSGFQLRSTTYLD